MRCFAYSGLLTLAAVCCATAAHARPLSGYYANPEIDELRIELDDLKHALKTTQVELGLLDERLQKQSDKALDRRASSCQRSSAHPTASVAT